MEITIGQRSSFNILATTSQSPWVHYNLYNGSLPNGLTLNIVSGDITGIARIPGIYNFTVKAYAYNIPEPSYKTFTITVLDDPNYLPNKLVSILTGPEKFNVLADYIGSVYYPYIFRPDDDNFGLVRNNQISILSNIPNNYNGIINILNQRLVSQLSPNRFKTSSVIINNTKIAECVYLNFNDSSRLSDESFLSGISTIYPGGIYNYRKSLVADLGYQYSFEDWHYTDFQTDVVNNQFLADHDLQVGDIIQFTDTGYNLPSPYAFNTDYKITSIGPGWFKIIDFNVNETLDIAGSYRGFIIGLPFAYILSGKGNIVANGLNTYYSSYFTSPVKHQLDPYRVFVIPKDPYYNYTCSNSVITVANHGFSTGEAIKFETGKNDTDNWYYVLNPTANTFQISYLFRGDILTLLDCSGTLKWSNIYGG